MSNEQIIEKINAVASEQWFTSTDVVGRPNQRVASMLYKIASANDDAATLQEQDGRVLISSAGGNTRYQWVSKAYWLTVLNG